MHKKIFALIACIIIAMNRPCFAQQNISKLQSERQKLLKQVENIKKVMRSNDRRTMENMSQISAINKQIEVNKLLAKNIDSEIEGLDCEIGEKLRLIDGLLVDLSKLKKEYAKIIYLGYKATHGVHEMVYVFSAPSFHELAERVRYVRQYSKFRQRHFDEMKKVFNNLTKQKAEAEEYRKMKVDLVNLKKQELAKLIKLKEEHSSLVASLSKDKKLLAKQLDDHNRSMKTLDTLIKKVIAEEERRRRQAEEKRKLDEEKKRKAEEQKKKKDHNRGGEKFFTKEKKKKNSIPDQDISAAFKKNKGKLPWPVKNGVVVGKFGVWPHPVLADIKMENLGINIRTKPHAEVRSIFQGVVRSIAFVPGMENVVIIQHGTYHTVYARMSKIKVKSGQTVNGGEVIGTVYTNSDDHAELQLQVWENITRLNPEHWIE